MREMVEKVKKGEPLYGVTELTPYMQGVAARNSRYSAVMGHVIPWPNTVNHNQVSDVDAVGSVIELTCQSMVSTLPSTINRQKESLMQNDHRAENRELCCVVGIDCFLLQTSQDVLQALVSSVHIGTAQSHHKEMDKIHDQTSSQAFPLLLAN